MLSTTEMIAAANAEMEFSAINAIRDNTNAPAKRAFCSGVAELNIQKLPV